VLLLTHYRAIGDMKRGDRLYGRCDAPGCGHEAELDVTALIKRYGPRWPFDRISCWLKCSACGNRNTQMVHYLHRLCEHVPDPPPVLFGKRKRRARRVVG